jgi:hypothetical protein
VRLLTADHDRYPRDFGEDASSPAPSPVPVPGIGCLLRLVLGAPFMTEVMLTTSSAGCVLAAAVGGE